MYFLINFKPFTIVIGNFSAIILLDKRLAKIINAFCLNALNGLISTRNTSGASIFLALCFVYNPNRMLLFDQFAACACPIHDLLSLSYALRKIAKDPAIKYRYFKTINFTSLQAILVISYTMESNLFNAYSGWTDQFFTTSVEKYVPVKPWFTNKT